MILALQEAFQKRLDGTGLLKDIEQEFFRLLLGFNSYLIVKIFINNYFSDFSINVFSSFYDNIIWLRCIRCDIVFWYFLTKSTVCCTKFNKSSMAKSAS